MKTQWMTLKVDIKNEGHFDSLVTHTWFDVGSDCKFPDTKVNNIVGISHNRVINICRNTEMCLRSGEYCKPNNSISTW